MRCGRGGCEGQRSAGGDGKDCREGVSEQHLGEDEGVRDGWMDGWVGREGRWDDEQKEVA